MKNTLSSFSDDPEMTQIQRSLGSLMKELEQIRATLTVHVDVSDCDPVRIRKSYKVQKQSLVVIEPVSWLLAMAL